jgi:hypothetical protein
MLEIAQFKPAPEPDYLMAEASKYPQEWARYVPEEEAFVKAVMRDGCLHLRLSPVIHHYEQHSRVRVTAGVSFELAAKYAEKVGGVITQHQNVSGCTAYESRRLVLAEYPALPLQWERVCAGFREVLLSCGLQLSVPNELLDQDPVSMRMRHV